MKKKLSLILLFVAFLSLTASAQDPTLVIHKSDGQVLEVELFTMPRVQMTTDKMTIKSAVLDLEFAKSDVVGFTYKNISTGIRTVHPEMTFRIDEDQVTFRGVPEANAVMVYDISGVRLPVRLTIHDNEAVLPLSQLPHGVYIVNINGKSFKILRP